MILKNIKDKQKKSGFTIVELLVVIVVIGILAAITIVSYTGITAKANTTKAQSNAESVQNVAETYNADKGYYPTYTTDFTTGSGSTKLPAGITLLTGVQALSTNKSASEVLWKYDGTAGAATGGTIQFWDFGTGAVSTTVTKVGTGLGTTEPAS